ncbi:MAG: formimidoylglutamase [Flavobacteriales bacterium]|nr:formimidoylglutamase [Flavobacteriales bacterium]
MDLSIYFTPLEITDGRYTGDSIGSKTHFFGKDSDFPEISDFDLVIFGAQEERNAKGNKGCAQAPKAIREKLYQLESNWHKVKLADLGDIMPGETIEDTYFALKTVIAQIIKLGKIPIVLGGSQDLTFANYQAYEQLEQVVNIVSVDNKLDLGDVDQPINSKGFLNKIILHQPNYLFNYSNIGYQTYFVSDEERRLMERLFFDIHRLGEVKRDIKEVEPIVRNADMVTFDISAIRFADAPGNENTTPNGFNGEDACAIARYAGLSDKLSSIGFYELNPNFDTNHQTAFLVSEMIWYFIEGFYNRKNDHLASSKKELLKYIVATSTEASEIVFYKNLKSDRWWMDVPYPESKLSKYRRHQLVPCSYSDYQEACHDKVPEKWWRNYHKLQ